MNEQQNYKMSAGSDLIVDGSYGMDILNAMCSSGGDKIDDKKVAEFGKIYVVIQKGKRINIHEAFTGHVQFITVPRIKPFQYTALFVIGKITGMNENSPLKMIVPERLLSMVAPKSHAIICSTRDEFLRGFTDELMVFCKYSAYVNVGSVEDFKQIKNGGGSSGSEEDSEDSEEDSDDCEEVGDDD